MGSVQPVSTPLLHKLGGKPLSKIKNLEMLNIANLCLFKYIAANTNRRKIIFIGMRYIYSRNRSF